MQTYCYFCKFVSLHAIVFAVLQAQELALFIYPIYPAMADWHDWHALLQATPRWLRRYSWDGEWTTTSPSTHSDEAARSFDSDGVALLSCSDESDEAECTLLDEEDLLSSMSLMAECFGIWKLYSNYNKGSLHRTRKRTRRRLAYLL